MMNSLNPLKLPLTGTHLIEASAGTGKTYTIAALYVRLILGHHVKNEFTPQNILVVTFTDAATEELRDRIRIRLSETAQYFREQISTTDAFLIELRESYTKNEWLFCAKRLEIAANFMDESAVFTIHSWSNRMLQQHAFDSANPFKQNVDTNDSELLNTVIQDYWRVHFYDLDKIQCEFILNHLAKSPNEFAEKIKDLLKETEALKIDVEIEFSDIFKKTEIKNAWKQKQTEINVLLETAINEKWISAAQDKFPKQDALNWLQKINDWVDDKDSCDVNALEKFTFSRLTENLLKKYQHKTDDFSKFSVFSSIENQNSVKQIKFHAVKWIRARYAQEKQALSRVTFDDMLNNLDVALQGQNASRLAQVIRMQYPVALIDEFQDTDPVQYRIFSNIYGNADNVGFFMIGDPKQAIYAFRGADIFTYLKAHKTTQNHHTLDTNFRSTKSLVNAINLLFEQADKQEKGAFYFKKNEQNPLPFLKVNAKGRADNWIIQNQIAPALTIWNWQSDDLINLDDYRNTMAKVTASEIVRLLSEKNTGFQSKTDFKPLQLNDIAILVRTGYEAKLIRRELNKRNLKSVFLSEKESIYDSDEARDVLFWLEAIANPRDEQKVKTALSTATFGFSTKQLHALTLNELAWETHLERFVIYHQRWQKNGILPALRLLIHDYGLHLNLNNHHENERQLTNILHLAELLQQSSMKIEGEEALIRHFADLIYNNNRAENENVIRLESDANLIKIITIHKSKGLEYPLVFLPFMSDCKKIDKKQNYYKFHDNNGDVCIDLDKSEENKKRNDVERLQEDLRILYVALTRAQYGCWLSFANTKRLADSAIGYALNLEKITNNANFISIENLPEITEFKFVNSQQTHSIGSVRHSVVSIPENWWVASYSLLKIENKKLDLLQQEIETAQDDAQREDEEIETLPVELSNNIDIYALPKGAKSGVLIHALLEKCGEFGFKNAFENVEWRQKNINAIFSDNAWDDEKRTVINNALAQWLTMPFFENLRLLDLQKTDYKNEVEFLIGADFVDVTTLDNLITQATLQNQMRPTLANNKINGFLKGFIDLLFCYENQFFIVDYKFNYLGNSQQHYEKNEMIKTMLKNRYDVQYTLYLLALHRLLKVRLGENYDYEKHVGGAIYLFLRGNQFIFDKPSKMLIEQLDTLFFCKK